MTKKLDLFINGAYEPPSSGSYSDLIGPASSGTLARVADADASDVDRAANAAARAFNGGVPASRTRADWLVRAANAMDQHREELANLLVAEVGKTIREGRNELRAAIAAISIYAEEATRVGGEVIRGDWYAGTADMEITSIRVPAGPVCAMTAFNAPINQSAHKIGAALAAGCPIVLKPSPQAPMAIARMVEIFSGLDFPPGWINLLFGEAEVGESLWKHQAFARYAFTGSRRVGQLLTNTVGLRPAVVELGSNAPNIVHHDCDLDRAVQSLIAGGFALGGQVCTRPQRVFGHADVYDLLLAKLSAAAQSLVVGDPAEESTDMGPVRSESAAQRIEEWVESAIQAGARVVTGGGRDGLFVEPTILTDVPPEHEVACEEVFGPVMVVEPYDSFQDVLTRANDSGYGLQAGIFTESIATYREAVRELRVGAVVVNGSSRLRAPQAPFGGVKGSGVGREGARHGVEAFTDVKTIFIQA